MTNMKGTLHKTGSGWQIWYHAKEHLFYGGTGVRILPLHPDAYSVNGPMKDVVTSWEGLEVEFEIIEFPVNSISKYAKLVDQKHTTMKGGEGWDKILDKAIEDKATRPLTEDDAWPKYPEVKIICPRCKALMPCECNKAKSLVDLMRPYSDMMNSNWNTIITEFHLATQQVHKGAPPLIFECWLVENYNPPTKKQD